MDNNPGSNVSSTTKGARWLLKFLQPFIPVGAKQQFKVPQPSAFTWLAHIAHEAAGVWAAAILLQQPSSTTQFAFGCSMAILLLAGVFLIWSHWFSDLDPAVEHAVYAVGNLLLNTGLCSVLPAILTGVPGFVLTLPIFFMLVLNGKVSYSTGLGRALLSLSLVAVPLSSQLSPMLKAGYVLNGIVPPIIYPLGRKHEILSPDGMHGFIEVVQCALSLMMAYGA